MKEFFGKEDERWVETRLSDRLDGFLPNARRIDVAPVAEEYHAAASVRCIEIDHESWC